MNSYRREKGLLNGFAIEIMNYLRSLLKEVQEETGHFYNLEATPAEGAAHRLAMKDKGLRFTSLNVLARIAQREEVKLAHLEQKKDKDPVEIAGLQKNVKALYDLNGTKANSKVFRQILTQFVACLARAV